MKYSNGYPIFGGNKGEDPEEFVTAFIRASIANNNYDQGKWLKMMEFFLEGKALRWYLNLEGPMKKE